MLPEVYGSFKRKRHRGGHAEQKNEHRSPIQLWGGHVPDEQTLKHNVQVLENERNRKQATVQWRFSSQDARVKLHRLYPSILD